MVDKLGAIGKLCNELVKIEDQERDLVAKLKSIKQKKYTLSGEIIPTALQEIGISRVDLEDGSAVDVKQVYRAHIKQENKEQAFNWLKKNKLEDIIKNKVIVSFGKGENEQALTLMQSLRDKGVEPIQDQKVEPMTLMAVVKEQYQIGVNMPDDIFGIYVGFETKIKRKKKEEDF